MKLIDNWRNSWKFSSMQLLFFATICDVIAVGALIIDDKFPIDPKVYVVLRLSMTILSMGARLVAQKDTE
ncbi:MAG: hypothetical protein ACK5LG_21880 [Bacteroides thetaiotaomicron]